MMLRSELLLYLSFMSVCIIDQKIFMQSYRGGSRRTDSGINSTTTVEALSLEGSNGLGSNAVYNSLRVFTTATPQMSMLSAIGNSAIPPFAGSEATFSTTYTFTIAFPDEQPGQSSILPSLK
ncbi:uncharacterized protein APUU_20784S [Aspergillus puulaauensis]|uniref:Uncharacterized protein n=1 Tax=Aspergillus puulaauensis TaxID=1220207 RepID=A0A7R8AJ91_9EURO|nr:uncharacterized protein APUU_20784S [Aspergillus puulaauensis]BCS20352.1 hypothetical protein APUU_20784S [Aspergillus puulaauensis]